MEIVIFDLETTEGGYSPNQEQIIAISAIRMKAGHLNAVQRFHTFAMCRPPLPHWVKTEDIRHAPGVPEALRRFSGFVGDAWLIADGGPGYKMPFIHEACLGPGQVIREVRVVDSRDFARKLWDDVCFGDLDDLSKKLTLSSEDDGVPWIARNVKLVAEAVHQMWSELSANFEVCPVGSCTGYLPAHGDEN